MKVAALDLGSNTFLCLIADVEKDKIGKIHFDTVEVVRLGQDVNKTKRLHPDALARAERCLKNFSDVIAKHRPEKVLAMATSAARDSENRQALFDIGKKFGIPIEIIPGEQEAQITFQGSISGLIENKERLIVDIGGGSTEFIIGDHSKIKVSESLNIGCVRLTEKFISVQPTPESEVSSLEKYIEEEVNSLASFGSHQVDEVLAVAGTPTALVTATLGKFDPAVIDGYRMSTHELLDWKRKLQSATVAQKIAMGIPEGRADVIFVGVLILLAALKKFKKDHIIASTRGVRHGIALELARRYLS